MLIKTGDRIVNTDLITVAEFQEPDTKQGRSTEILVLHFSDAANSTASQNRFSGEEAKTLWAALSAQAEKDSRP